VFRVRPFFFLSPFFGKSVSDCYFFIPEVPISGFLSVSLLVAPPWCAFPGALRPPLSHSTSLTLAVDLSPFLILVCHASLLHIALISKPPSSRLGMRLLSCELGFSYLGCLFRSVTSNSFQAVLSFFFFILVGLTLLIMLLIPLYLGLRMSLSSSARLMELFSNHPRCMV